MCKKLKQVAKVIQAVESASRKHTYPYLRVYRDENTVIYLIQCLNANYNLEMTISILTNPSDPYEKSQGSLTFGQSFDNDYKVVSFKKFKKLLKEIDNSITI